MDFVKSGCEKSWAEVQADSFSFECRRRAKMKGLDVDMAAREEVGCASGSGGGGNERDARAYFSLGRG